MPAQPPQLGGPQPGEDRRKQQRPVTPGRCVELADDRAHFGGRRDVDADLELAADIGARRTAVLAQRVNDILPDKTALLGVGEDAAKHAAGITHHGRRVPVPAQPILEAAHHGDCQLRELERT